jgi:hypothetical protein
VLDPFKTAAKCSSFDSPARRPLSSRAMEADELLARAVGRLDVPELARQFAEGGSLVFVPQLFTPDETAILSNAARAAESRAHRAWVPHMRKAGAVGQPFLRARAPLLHDLYVSPVLTRFLSQISGVPLFRKSPNDFHAVALYVYDRAGDHVDWHYDDCGCEEAASYTASIGLVHDCDARVEVELFRDRPAAERKRLDLRMSPGSFVFFCGTKAWHRVTPIRAGERRVVYSSAYVTEGKRSTGVRRFINNFYDAALYFGIRAVFQNNY